VSDPLSDDEFYTQLAGAQRSAYRVELQPSYYEPAEQATVDRFLAGDPQPPTEVASLVAWYALVSGLTGRGAAVARVRVQEDPPNPYQQWERYITPWNVAAGEDMRYLTHARAHEIGLLPAAGQHDWWLLDGARLIVMEFDSSGRRVRTELVTDRDRVEQAAAWWQLAYANSAPMAGDTTA
jgi:hypothetical protein